MAVVKAVHSKAKLSVAIAYITKREKTEQRLVTGLQCSPGSAVMEMETTKQLWRKTGGRQYDHYIQSFAPGEPVSPEIAHRIACQWAAHQFPGYECVVVTHVDREHVHSHVIVNSVSYETGRKLHTTAHWLQEAKNHSDRLCQRNGLSICQKGKTFDGQPREDATSWSKDQYQLLEKASRGEAKSFLVEIAVAIAIALKSAVSKDDFIQKLLEQGVTTVWTDKRKHITFSDLEGNKVRNSKLEKIFHMDFSKEAFTHEFEERSREAHCAVSKPQLQPPVSAGTGAAQHSESAPQQRYTGRETQRTHTDARNTSALHGNPTGCPAQPSSAPGQRNPQQTNHPRRLADRLEEAARELQRRNQNQQQQAQRRHAKGLDR